MVNKADIQKPMLMGPGPSDVHPRVLEAMAMPPLGYLDSHFFEILDDIRQMLKAVFQTKNELTLAVSGTGMAGMETCVVNLIEPGDTMLVCVSGFFGTRMKEVAERAGAQVKTIEIPWGNVFTVEQVEQALRDHGPFKVVSIVHAETSTGAAQPIEAISRAVHNAGALLLVDAVTSLGGLNVNVDSWEIDACFSVSQKCTCYVQPGRRARYGQSQEQGPKLVPGHEHGSPVLGAGADVPPHCPDQHELRSA